MTTIVLAGQGGTILLEIDERIAFSRCKCFFKSTQTRYIGADSPHHIAERLLGVIGKQGLDVLGEYENEQIVYGLCLEEANHCFYVSQPSVDKTQKVLIQDASKASPVWVGAITLDATQIEEWRAQLVMLLYKAY